MKKKILSLMLAVCVVLGLSACGGEEEVEDALVCTMEQSGMTFTMRMDAKGDTVTNVEQETVVSTEGFTEDQIQQLRAAIEEAAAAYEAIEGTDKCIERGCKLGGKGITVVKVSKPTQDKRFDIPAIGLNTLKTMDRFGAKILAIEANETIIVDQKKVIEFADKKGIIVMAI